MAADSFELWNVQTSPLQVREGQVLRSAAAFGSQHSKIEKAAKDFEAILLDNWLEKAEESFATVPGSDDQDDPGRTQMMSMGIEALANSIAGSGGLGIAKMIASSLQSKETKQIEPEARPET